MGKIALFCFPETKFFPPLCHNWRRYEQIWKIDGLQGKHDSYESYPSYLSDTVPGTAPNAGSVTFGRLWQPFGRGSNAA